jgi:hypothetical protein
MNCATAMDVPTYGSIVITDLTFPYANTLTKKVLSNTWSDLFSGIAPALCGAVDCRIQRTSDCGWSYTGAHITPTGWMDPAKLEAD